MNQSQTLTGSERADMALAHAFALVFGVFFVETAFSRFGGVDYRQLGWVCLSAAFWTLVVHHTADFAGVAL